MSNVDIKFGSGFRGLEIVVRRFGGASCSRVIHTEQQAIKEHQHDFVCLTIPMLGACIEKFEGKTVVLGGASFVLHPANVRHSDAIENEPFETVSLQFERGWLQRAGLTEEIDRTVFHQGGKLGGQARRLAALWTDLSVTENTLAQATVHLLARLRQAPSMLQQPWLKAASAIVRNDVNIPTSQLAAMFTRHPASVSRGYRAWAGEGLSDVRRRRRAETAVSLLRHTDMGFLEVALAAGFCDQSHMNRTLKALIGRTPSAVRAERNSLNELFGPLSYPA